MIPYSGRWGVVHIASKTTTAYDIGDIVYNDGTNNVPGAAAATSLIGICIENKSSSDSSTKSIAIKVPKDKSATFIATVTGTFTKASEGKEFDLSNETTINAAGTTNKVVRCIKYINSTTGVFQIV